MQPARDNTNGGGRSGSDIGIQRIGVIGSGLMGTDISLHLLSSGLDLVWVVQRPEFIPESESRARKLLERRRRMGLSPSGGNDDDLFKVTEKPEALQECDIVIESITEDLSAKQQVLAQVSRIVARDCVIASNTSSLPLERIFSGCDGSGRCLGLHFFYPVKMTGTVEINLQGTAEPWALGKTRRLLERIGKQELLLQEKAWFAVNRMLIDLQVVCCVLATRENIAYNLIDDAVKNRIGLPAGIFEAMDAIGLDTLANALKSYRSYLPNLECYSILIDQAASMAAAGQLGKKSGKGFYRYENGRMNNCLVNEPAPGLDSNICDLIMVTFVNSFFKAVEETGLSPSTLDRLVMNALNTMSSLEIYNSLGRESIETSFRKLEVECGQGFVRSELMKSGPDRISFQATQ